MQILKFKSLCIELGRPEALSPAESLGGTYFKIAEDWFIAPGERVTDEALLECLNSASEEGWRRTNAKSAYYRLSQHNAVIEVRFGSSPIGSTLKKVAKRIQKGVIHSTQAFDATHDSLTGLLNRRGFEEEIKSSIGPSPTLTQTSDALDSSLMAGVIEMDIDHFKQINDTHGHAYGDAVLKTFARRLADNASRLTRSHNADLELVVSRFGGEEFFVCAINITGEDELASIAESLRLAIEVEVLPTENEWANEPRDALRLPHASERRVTASVGVSSVGPVSGLQANHSIIETLRLEADAALYRAKSGGRNVVRRFQEILTRHGRVVAHRPEMDVVVIDIGSNVKVAFGQEFLVFHPDFVGGKPIVHSDGRSTKRIGEYPRMPHGRVVVSDVQPEIAICRVASGTVFPAGSSVELVPMGTISHLVSPGRMATAASMHSSRYDEAVSKINARIDEYAQQASDGKAENQLSVAVFTLDDVFELTKTRGTSFINGALGSLFDALRRTLPSSAQIEQIQPTEFAVLFRPEPGLDVRKQCSDALAAAGTLADRDVHFGYGLYVHGTQSAQPTHGDHSVYEAKHALAYARFAASSESRKGSESKQFDAIVAQNLMVDSRSKGQIEKALADYAAFKKIGLRSGWLENQVALCHLMKRKPDYAQALLYVHTAIELFPGEAVLVANRGTIELLSGDAVKAHHSFVEAIQLRQSLAEVKPYLVPRAVAMYATFKQDRSAVNREELESLLERAMALPLQNSRYISNPQEIADALAAVRSAQSGTQEPA